MIGNFRRRRLAGAWAVATLLRGQVARMRLALLSGTGEADDETSLALGRRRGSDNAIGDLGGKVGQGVRLEKGGNHRALRLLGKHGLLDNFPRAPHNPGQSDRRLPEVDIHLPVFSSLFQMVAA
jgi:hypothetical protein